jgi:hypothetical protein
LLLLLGRENTHELGSLYVVLNGSSLQERG